MNIACITCKHVISGERPVLLLSNVGGDYQALCGDDDHDFDREGGGIDDAFAVHIGHIIDADKTTEHIFDLEIDWSSRRDTKESKWIDYYDPG